MSKSWGSLLIALWLLILFSDVMPLTWRAAVLVVPVSLTLVGLLHFNGDNLWRPPGYAALVGWFVLLLIQCVPLPPALLAYLSPGGYQLYSETVWVLRPDVWMPLGLVSQSAFLWLLQFMVMGGLFFITVQTGADHVGLGKLLQWFGVAIGLVALSILGIRLISSGEGLNGEYLDRLFRGGMVALAALVPVVLGSHLYARPHQNYGKWSKRLVQALRHPASHLHGYLLVSALLMSLVVTRFGAPQIQISLACGLLIMTLMLLLRPTSRAGCMTAVVLSLLVLVMVGLGSRKTMHGDTIDSSVTGFTSLNSQALIKDFVLFGAGPGTLPGLKLRYTNLTVSSAVQKSRGVGFTVLSEGGLVGAGLTLYFWIAVLLAGVMGWIRRRNHLSMYLLPGVFAGLVVCFVAGSDSLQPAAMWPGLTGFFLAALLIAIGCFSSSGEPDAVLGDLSLGARWLMIFFAGIIGLAGLAYVGGQTWLTLSQRLGPAATTVAITEQAADPLEALEKRSRYNPLEAEHWFAIGSYWAVNREDAKATASFSRALRLNPLAGGSLYHVGSWLAGRGSLDIGQKLMRAGLKNNPFSKVLQREHLLYLLSTSDDQQALMTLSTLLLLDPEQTGFWLRYFENKNIPIKKWRDYLPLRAEVYRQFGDYLDLKKEASEAGAVYMQAVKLAVAEPSVSPELFRQISAYFINKEGFDMALEVLRLGMESRPKDLSLLLTAGRLYQRLGVTYRAEELYRKALLLDPDNPEVRSMLETL